MILVLSQSSFESTTDLVLDYLRAMGAPALRINGSDFDAGGDFSLRLDGGAVEIDAAPLRLDLAAVRAVWYRRWMEGQPFQEGNLLRDGGNDSYVVTRLAADHMVAELRRVSQILFSQLSHAAWLSEPRTASPNKLRVLQLAARAGLATPATLVTTSRDQLQRFAAVHGPVITKPIGDFDCFTLDGQGHIFYTRELDPELIASLPAHFFPSLFQERLVKEYEVRVFHLAGESWASAIFSQLDPRTATDFRRYNLQRPNRVVPFALPADCAERIVRLMAELELESGSLDLVRTADGRLVFLEVNPVGQFGMVSQPCNYHLEHKVAQRLASMAGHGV
jgi:ATP-GRASP peptide maturase of grasp-with-spasm system